MVDFAGGAVPPPKQAQGFPLRRVAGPAGGRTLLLVGLMLFFQSGMEITLGGWSAVRPRGAAARARSGAILVLSLFWVGMIAARLGAHAGCCGPGRAATVLPGVPGVAIAGAVHAAGGAGARRGRARPLPARLRAGGGIPGRPGVPRRAATSDLTGTAFSAVFVMALIGGSTLPYLTGLLGDRSGLRGIAGGRTHGRADHRDALACPAAAAAGRSPRTPRRSTEAEG